MRFLFFYFFIFLFFLNESNATSDQAKKTLEEQGYVCSKQSVFEDILGLNKDDIQNLTGIATGDRAENEGFSGRLHNNEFRTATGITVIKTSEGFSTFIPYKSDKNLEKACAMSQDLQERHFNPKEEQTLKKLGENIARLTGLNALIAYIVFYDDKGISTNAIPPHQDRYTSFLGFGVLERESNCTLIETEIGNHSKHSNVFQKLGLTYKSNLLNDYELKTEAIDKMENLETLTDQKGAGYFVNQKLEKDGEIIVHQRTAKTCNNKRVVCILRIIAAEDAETESLKKVYLSSPEIAKALRKQPTFMTKNKKHHIDTDNAAPEIKRAKH